MIWRQARVHADLIIGLRRNHMADTAPRILDIAEKPRDEVDVKVEDCLSRGCSTVDTDVIAIGLVPLLDDGLRGPDHFQ